jgi:hypothetical protein
VRDSGVGIDTQHREQVFEAFFQVDNPGRDRSRGLGLGLSLVASMARMMGSRIVVRSEAGRGSTFSLVLQAAQAAPAASADSAPAPLGAVEAPRRVLVLDDEEPVRRAMATLLRGWGLCSAKSRLLTRDTGLERLNRKSERFGGQPNSATGTWLSARPSTRGAIHPTRALRARARPAPIDAELRLWIAAPSHEEGPARPGPTRCEGVRRCSARPTREGLISSAAPIAGSPSPGTRGESFR